MKSNVRVRFAPSPTGPLHIGGVRTALYNYLFAKKHNGTFILRIEDTDKSRYVVNAEQYIIDALDWCAIPFDEGPNKNEKMGPYRQSERLELYNKHIDILIKKGCAYYAFDTPVELDQYRKKYESEGKTFSYNGHNREKGKLINSLVLTDDEVQNRINSRENYVVRFKTPQNKLLTIEDDIRKTIKINTSVLDDKVLFKSDGMPTYHLASVIDDKLMQISHVIRGEEWLPSLPLHILLYESFGWSPPKFSHLPLLLKPSGKGKLSKRDSKVLEVPIFPLSYSNEKTFEVYPGFKEEGYFPEAFINIIAFLGWNPGNEKEIFSLKELIQSFELGKVSKAGAKFSPEKAKWFNQQYMQSKSDEELAELYLPILIKKGVSIKKEYVQKIISLIKERLILISDFWKLSSFFFEAPIEYDNKAAKKHWNPKAILILRELVCVINEIKNFSSENIEKNIKSWVLVKEIGLGSLMQSLRLCIVGKLVGPRMFDIMNIIGKEETINRIERAVKKIK